MALTQEEEDLLLSMVSFSPEKFATFEAYTSAFVPCPPVIPANPQPPGVTVPGFGRIQAIKAEIDGTPNPYDLANALLAQINPLLAPFNFILKIVEVVFAIYKTLQSVTNPFKLAKNLKKLAKALGGLTVFIPNLAWVRMVRDMIDICVAILNGFVAIINAWVRDINALRRAFVARDNMPEDPEIVELIRCTKGMVASNIDGVNGTLAAFATALEFVGQLMELLGSFMPGGVTKSFTNAIRDVVAIPAGFALLKDLINAAQAVPDLDEILVKMRELALTIGDAAGALASISQLITDVVGE